MQTIYDAKILIVDDNQDLLNLVTTALRSTGYNQLTACTGCAAAQAAFAANRPDLMILDINLPDGDGFTLFRTLHSMADIPALFLSARDADADRLFGPGLVADDYLTKPFGVMEMVSRVKAVLRRCHPADTGHVLSAGGLSMDLDCRTVTADGQRLQLTYKEFELLRLFLSHPGMAFTREQLFTQVWNMEYMDDSRTLDMHIRTLRQKLGAYGKLIETVRNVGYRMETGL